MVLSLPIFLINFKPSKKRYIMKKRLNLSLILALCFSVALSAQGNDEWGIASYYHDSFHGKETAYGVKYDKKAMTAAHRELPYGTMVRVTRLDNNKSVVVKVTDKGPYKRGRVVDLSRAAAERIGLIQDGLTEVKLEVVKRGTAAPKKPSKKTQRKERQASAPSSYENISRDRIVTDAGNAPAPSKKKVASSSSKPADAEVKPKGKAKKAAPAAQPKLVGKEYQKYGLYKISIQEPGEKGFAVQVASLTNYENVFKQVADLQAKWFDNVLISIEEGSRMPSYKVLLGPFKEEAAAENYRKNLMKKHKIKGFVVDLNAVEYSKER